MDYFDLQFSQLMSYGVHIGHTRRNTLVGAAWMISSFRQDVAVINLWKSIYILKVTFFFVSNIIAFLGPIWFLNFNPLAHKYVKACASLCGEFSVTSKWIRGAVSNFWATFKAYRVIAQVPEVVLLSKYNKFKSFLTNWHFSRFSWPRALFISNLENSHFAAREATALKIPSFGIVDTNSLSQIVLLPIPGNDESTLCLILYNDLMSNYILSRKFSMVLMWFLNVRSVSRIATFSNWIKSYYTITRKETLTPAKSLQIVTVSTYNNLYKGISLFLSKNYALTAVFEQLDIFSNSKTIFNFAPMTDSVLKRKAVLNKALRINFIKKIILLRKNNIKKKFLRDFLFRHKFLNRKFLNTKFLTSSFTRGKFKSVRIKIKRGFLRNKKFFLNSLSNFYFYNKYKNYLLRRSLKGSFLNHNLRYAHFSSIVKAVISRYSSQFNTFFAKKGSHLNDKILASYNKKYAQYRHVYYPWLCTKVLDKAEEEKRDPNVIYNQMSLKTQIGISPKLIKYTKRIASSKSKLKFFVSNISFGTYLKYNLVWNLRSLTFNHKTLSNKMKTFYFLGFFKRNALGNTPIIFESFLTRKLRKFFGTIRFRNLSVWMWH